MNHTKLLFSRQHTYLLSSLSVGALLCSADVMASGKGLQGYVLQVQMTPAICALDRTKAKHRKCLEGYSLTIKGLIPETSRHDCQTSSSATLAPLQKRVVARVMPDEQARIRLWANYGGCVPMNASQYFRTIINHADQLKVPDYLTGVDRKTVSISTLRSQFIKLNPKLPSQGIEFQCQSLNGRPVLTGVEICYRTNGQFKSCASDIVSTCPNTFDIEGAY
ncbi:ribonuclease T2 family protein [Acinetobacter sp. DSM 11652]|uniref:ribonuclease T2 family protein n=1 Tax=Acinetobacter sp. DSM 11652 TaxID=346222 RepID=UPI0008BC2C6F|nr:ribonuclease I [Acinetobacter sp. DSM 11652]SEM13356.1 ribonuclease T2 [Acinetobacter sp. DSM 11652]